MSLLKGFLFNYTIKSIKNNGFDINNVRTLKTALKIKWVRPVKKPLIHPDVSGDRTSLPKYNLKQTVLEFEKSKELETADENVKKIFAMEMNREVPKLQKYTRDLIDSVKRHPLDEKTHEVRIARLTAKIRYFQEVMEKEPRNVKIKVRLQHMIDNRKKQLKHLRRWDYPRFEWILEKLDLVYRPYPSNFEQVTRKRSMTQLTTIHCEEIKEKKMTEYRKQLDKEKVPFLEKKLNRLNWIKEQEKELGLEQTVTDQDISECAQQLEQMRLLAPTLENKNYQRIIHPFTLEKYNPEELLKAEGKKSD